MIETRIATEVRAEGRKLSGYAATFHNETRILDFNETIAPGAFAASLRSNGDILALVDHDNGKVLARTKSGTLRLSEDARGLAFEIDVPPTTLGNDILAMATRSDLGGMSLASPCRKVETSGEATSARCGTLFFTKSASCSPSRLMAARPFRHELASSAQTPTDGSLF